MTERTGHLRIRWAAIGAAVAVTLGAGTIATVDAVQSEGERLTYVAGEPCRLMNTRPGDRQVGPRMEPLPEGTPITVEARGAQGNCTADQLPDDAVALQLNVTPVNATLPTDITIWPSGDIPQASSVNPRPGIVDPNAVVATLHTDGTFQMQNKFGTIDMVIDVLGYFVDHDHDDRYYTETESDDRFVPAQPDVIHPLLASGTSSGFTYQAGLWERPAAGGESCITFPVDVPAGRTVDRIEMTYSSDAAAQAQMTFFSIDRTPKEIGSETELLNLYLATVITMPETNASTTQTQTFVFEDDATVEPTLGRTTTVDNGTANVFFCTDVGPLTVAGLTVFLEPV